ncbi:hypothetical protein ADZ37_24465 [Pannonibacter phragmitetus]|uniref:hypothetical protein n=1 Tax=Pannonibacter phragmitetus TaxID=121719 RepID=UPI00067E2D4D|nr:hypothetical protein [Pannonibacter phragmitetus]KND16172.1 hypothetical protein ADZ37_24465 [Pannonibacter phragmitetus]
METPTAADEKQAKPKFFTRHFLLAWGGMSVAYLPLTLMGEGNKPYVYRYISQQANLPFLVEPAGPAWWELPQALTAPIASWITRTLFEVFSFPPSIGGYTMPIGMFSSALLAGFCLAWAGRKVLELLRSR